MSHDSSIQTNTFVWGKDLSGSFQGAGGIGGLAISSFGGTGSTPSACFPAFDGNGNLMGLVSTSGTIVASYDYDPFGEVVSSSGTVASVNHFRFSTKYTDSESGLLYYGYRFYSPNAGRWLSRDPLGEVIGRNLYSRDRNDLILFIDGLGLCEKTFGAGVNVQASVSGYGGIGATLKLGVYGTIYNCCNGVEIRSGAWDVTVRAEVNVGFGVGGGFELPGIGKIEGLLKGPQLTYSPSLGLAKGCDEKSVDLEYHVGDVSGDLGASLSGGLGFGAKIEYWSKYMFSSIITVHERTVTLANKLGWKGGGKWEVNTPLINVHGIFDPYDYQQELDASVSF